MKKLNHNQKTFVTTDDSEKKKYRKYAWKALMLVLKLAGWVWKLLDLL